MVNWGRGADIRVGGQRFRLWEMEHAWRWDSRQPAYQEFVQIEKAKNTRIQRVGFPLNKGRASWARIYGAGPTQTRLNASLQRMLGDSARRHRDPF
jgi:hypothetical protein